MKKNKEMLTGTNSKKDVPDIMSKEKTRKTSDKNKNEDLGAMKIGKAHSMEDNNVSIRIKEKSK